MSMYVEVGGELYGLEFQIRKASSGGEGFDKFNVVIISERNSQRIYSYDDLDIQDLEEMAMLFSDLVRKVKEI